MAAPRSFLLGGTPTTQFDYSQGIGDRQRALNAMMSGIVDLAKAGRDIDAYLTHKEVVTATTRYTGIVDDWYNRQSRYAGEDFRSETGNFISETLEKVSESLSSDRARSLFSASVEAYNMSKNTDASILSDVAVERNKTKNFMGLITDSLRQILSTTSGDEVARLSQAENNLLAFANTSLQTQQVTQDTYDKMVQKINSLSLETAKYLITKEPETSRQLAELYMDRWGADNYNEIIRSVRASTTSMSSADRSYIERTIEGITKEAKTKGTVLELDELRSLYSNIHTEPSIIEARAKETYRKMQIGKEVFDQNNLNILTDTSSLIVELQSITGKAIDPELKKELIASIQDELTLRRTNPAQAARRHPITAEATKKLEGRVVELVDSGLTGQELVSAVAKESAIVTDAMYRVQESWGILPGSIRPLEKESIQLFAFTFRDAIMPEEKIAVVQNLVNSLATNPSDRPDRARVAFRQIVSEGASSPELNIILDNTEITDNGDIVGNRQNTRYLLGILATPVKDTADSEEIKKKANELVGNFYSGKSEVGEDTSRRVEDEDTISHVAKVIKDRNPSYSNEKAVEVAYDLVIGRTRANVMIDGEMRTIPKRVAIGGGFQELTPAALDTITEVGKLKSSLVTHIDTTLIKQALSPAEALSIGDEDVAAYVEQRTKWVVDGKDMVLHYTDNQGNVLDDVVRLLNGNDVVIPQSRAMTWQNLVVTDRAARRPFSPWPGVLTLEPPEEPMLEKAFLQELGL